MRTGFRWQMGVGAATWVLSISTALAQEALEEIVVTAQKREQNLQEVPIAVAAFSGDQLKEAGAVQPLDLAAMTPNLTAKNAVQHRPHLRPARHRSQRLCHQRYATGRRLRRRSLSCQQLPARLRSHGSQTRRGA